MVDFQAEVCRLAGMTKQNVYRIELDHQGRLPIAAYYERFAAHNYPLNTFTFSGVSFMGTKDNYKYICDVDISGEVLSIIRYQPNEDGRYPDGVLYEFTFAGGTVVRVFSSENEYFYPNIKDYQRAE